MKIELMGKEREREKERKTSKISFWKKEQERSFFEGD